MLRQIKQTNGIEFENLVFDSTEEAINYLLPRIRPQSRQFYLSEITRELDNEGSTIIDRHAGNGTYFVARLADTSAGLPPGPQ